MEILKDNKAIITISSHTVDTTDIFQINGTFTEKELPDMTRLRRHASCTCMLHKTLTQTEKEYFDFIKKANDRVGRDIRTIDVNACG